MTKNLTYCYSISSTSLINVAEFAVKHASEVISTFSVACGDLWETKCSGVCATPLYIHSCFYVQSLYIVVIRGYVF